MTEPETPKEKPQAVREVMQWIRSKAKPENMSRHLSKKRAKAMAKKAWENRRKKGETNAES